MGIGVAAKALISKWVPPNERAMFLAIMAGKLQYLFLIVSYKDSFLRFWTFRIVFRSFVFILSKRMDFTLTRLEICFLRDWIFLFHLVHLLAINGTRNSKRRSTNLLKRINVYRKINWRCSI